MFGAPPSGVAAPPTAGAMAENTQSARMRLERGASLQARPMVTAMETNRMARGTFGAMADIMPTPMMKTNRRRAELPLTMGRLKHQ